MSEPRDDLLQLPTRRRLYDAVGARPGSSARDLQRTLGLGWGETAYHLDRLTRQALIRRERNGRQHAYFQSDILWEDRKLLVALQSPSARQVMLLLLPGSWGLSFGELQSRGNLTKSTLSFHLGNLVRTGIVEPHLTPGGRRFQLIAPQRVAQLATKYRELYRDRLVDRLVDMWGTIYSE